MKTYRVMSMFIGLLLISQSQASKNRANRPVLTNNCHCNCGGSSKLLITLMRSVLTQCINKRRLSTDDCLPKNCPKVPKNCAEVLKCGGKQQSGVYSVDPDGKGAFKVYCDQRTGGGGWAVIQRRKDGSVDFNRGWDDYKRGFGNLKGEFWLGLDKIYRLTHQARNRLRVELESKTAKTAYAEYSYFAVSSERANYELRLGSYSGTAGDSLSYHRGMAFSTKDRDNDKSSSNCAATAKGAWWYNTCFKSCLNGPYSKSVSNYYGISWESWKETYRFAKGSSMKVRPV